MALSFQSSSSSMPFALLTYDSHCTSSSSSSYFLDLCCCCFFLLAALMAALAFALAFASSAAFWAANSGLSLNQSSLQTQNLSRNITTTRGATDRTSRKSVPLVSTFYVGRFSFYRLFFTTIQIGQTVETLAIWLKIIAFWPLKLSNNFLYATKYYHLTFQFYQVLILYTVR